MEKIQFTTKDGVNLSADIWDASASRSVLLLHMMPETKQSWIPLADKLFEQGMNVLAIDFRGHGESEGGDYKTFSEEQHHGYFEDVRASAEFLQARYPGSVIMPGGASIGANMALWYMSEHHDAPKGFALSAGLDYYGVRAIDFVPKLAASQSALFVGSQDDGRASGMNCGDMAEQLYEQATSKKEKIIFETGGHGTDMFASHPELVEKLASFFLIIDQK